MAGTVDVAVVGGGPAGLAVAIGAARHGLDTLVVERGAFPVDKACGEGVMPRGVAELVALGARHRLDPDGVAPIRGVRFREPDGTCVEARLPREGLGIRRLALSQALGDAARGAGARLFERCKLYGCRRELWGFVLETSRGELRTRFLVGADGLGSRVRQALGMSASSSRAQRFGMRQHYCVEPWTDHVEIYLSDDAEAYVTPSGPHRVGVALLWSRARVACASQPALMARFPELAARLQRAQVGSRVAGAGPFARFVRSPIADGAALVGDAAGYVDAITGEGVSLALVCAAALVEDLPQAVVTGRRTALAPYERVFLREFRHYALGARALLAALRYPFLRRRLSRVLARLPRVADQLVMHLVGPPR